MYMRIQIHAYINIYIYIYIERERERDLKDNEQIQPKYVLKNYMKIIMARWLNDHNEVNLEKN